jgi:hypothetical protein
MNAMREVRLAAAAVAVTAAVTAALIVTEMSGAMNAITGEDVVTVTTKTFMEVPSREWCSKVIQMSFTAPSVQSRVPVILEYTATERHVTKVTTSTLTSSFNSVDWLDDYVHSLIIVFAKSGSIVIKMRPFEMISGKYLIQYRLYDQLK